MKISRRCRSRTQGEEVKGDFRSLKECHKVKKWDIFSPLTLENKNFHSLNIRKGVEISQKGKYKVC